MYSLYSKVQNYIIKIFTFFIYFSCLIVPLLLFFQVIYRYIYKRPINALEEIATVAFMWMIIFGSAIIFKNKKHIVVDSFINALPKNARKIAALVSDIFVAIILVYLIRSCVMAIPMQKVYRTVILGIPKSVHTIAFCISLIFMFVCCIESIVKRILKWGGKTIES